MFKLVERPLNIFCPSRGPLFYQKERNFRVRLKIKKWRSNLGQPNVYVCLLEGVWIFMEMKKKAKSFKVHVLSFINKIINVPEKFGIIKLLLSFVLLYTSIYSEVKPHLIYSEVKPHYKCFDHLHQIWTELFMFSHH